MAWPTADGVWHIGTGLTLPPGASLADLNTLLALRDIEREQIGFHRPNDEASSTRSSTRPPARRRPDRPVDRPGLRRRSLEPGDG